MDARTFLERYNELTTDVFDVATRLTYELQRLYTSYAGIDRTSASRWSLLTSPEDIFVDAIIPGSRDLVIEVVFQDQSSRRRYDEESAVQFPLEYLDDPESWMLRVREGVQTRLEAERVRRQRFSKRGTIVSRIRELEGLERSAKTLETEFPKKFTDELEKLREELTDYEDVAPTGRTGFPRATPRV